jgi:hypothetical protein
MGHRHGPLAGQRYRNAVGDRDHERETFAVGDEGIPLAGEARTFHAQDRVPRDLPHPRRPSAVHRGRDTCAVLGDRLGVVADGSGDV